MNVQELRETAKRLGIDAAVQDIAYRAVNKVTNVFVLKALDLTMKNVNRDLLGAKGGYRWGFVDGPTLHRALRRGDDLAMDAAFIDRTLAKGDRCYAAIDGERIVSYGWYSTRPTTVTLIADDMTLCFDPAYAYMYRAYTIPAYRGRRLNGIGVARALRIHAQEGKKGVLSCVDANNRSSLIACDRLGYRHFGWLVCAPLAGQYILHASGGCEAYGLRLVPAARK